MLMTIAPQPKKAPKRAVTDARAIHQAEQRVWRALATLLPGDRVALLRETLTQAEYDEQARRRVRGR
jgi:hypothetical protein